MSYRVGICGRDTFGKMVGDYATVTKSTYREMIQIFDLYVDALLHQGYFQDQEEPDENDPVADRVEKFARFGHVRYVYWNEE